MRPSPGIPCALFDLRGPSYLQHSGANAPRDRADVSTMLQARMSGRPDHDGQGAADVSHFRCCAKGLERASHPDQFAAKLKPLLWNNRGPGEANVLF